MIDRHCQVSNAHRPGTRCGRCAATRAMLAEVHRRGLDDRWGTFALWSEHGHLRAEIAACVSNAGATRRAIAREERFERHTGNGFECARDYLRRAAANRACLAVVLP